MEKYQLECTYVNGNQIFREEGTGLISYKFVTDIKMALYKRRMCSFRIVCNMIRTNHNYTNISVSVRKFYSLFPPPPALSIFHICLNTGLP